MREAAKNYYRLLLKPEVVFALLASIFGVLSAFLVPQLSVSDENMHFLRAYNLASGDLGEKTCSYPVDVNQKASSIYEGNYNADYEKTVNFSNTIESTCGSAAAYPPILHAPQALGIFLAKLVHPSTGLMVLVGRLSSLLLYVLAVYFIIKHVRLAKWVFVVISLFPLMIHMAASLSADVVNNIAVLAFAALLFNLFTQKTKITRRQSVLLLAIVGALSLTKLANVILLLPLAFLPVRLFEKNKIRRIPFNTHKWTLGIVCIILVIVLVAVWQKIYGAPLVVEGPENPLTTNPLHFLTILSATYINPFIGYTDVVFRGLIGEFASFRYHLPMFLVVINFCLLLFVSLLKDKDEARFDTKPLRWLSLSALCALVLFVASVSYAMYTAWAIQPFRLGAGALYADGVQGRYFTAALIFLAPLFIWLRKFYWTQVKSEETLCLLVYLVSGGSLLFYIIETYRFFS